jgi:electron transport complex protein RnfG
MIKVLGTVSVVCGLLIVGAEVNTHARIRQNQEIMMKESVAHLLPGIQKQVIYGIGEKGQLTILPGVEGENVNRMFAGYDASGKFLGVVMEASGRGYSEVISAMYAYSPDKKTITGFQVVDMKETPGLGNRIGSDEKFADNFKALDATHPIKTVKHGTKQNPWEIDAISGATVSSRAVGRMLQKSVADMVPIINQNLDRIKRGD